MSGHAPGLSLLTIGAVERETGLQKDTLRVWERRYGFPKPARDDAGERLYTLEDVTRLRLIRRLMDQGHRPGRLMAADDASLHLLLDRERATCPSCPPPDGVMDAIRNHDVDALRRLLQHALRERGLHGLVADVIAPLNVQIGEAWLRGDLGVPDEHFYTEQMQTFLRGTLAGQPRSDRPPRVVLTTLPEEEHALGLLMAETLLSAEGAQCCSLGPRMPLADICRSAHTVGADVVALSFSAAFPARRAVSGVKALREALPPSVELWVGGAGVRDRLRSEAGVRLIRDVADVPSAVADWRARR